MKLTIIHDPEHKEREKKLIKQMHTQGVTDWDYSAAVYLNDPIEGIREAHLLAIENSFNNNGYGFIAEDDICFTSPNSMKYYLDNFKNLPKDWDLYLMGYYNFKAYPMKVAEGIIRLQYFTGMHGYMVSNKMREKLKQIKIKGHIDVCMAGNVIYSVHPVVAMQDLSLPSIRLGRVLTNYGRIENKVPKLKQ
jgi:hypothetical protein